MQEATATHNRGQKWRIRLSKGTTRIECTVLRLIEKDTVLSAILPTANKLEKSVEDGDLVKLHFYQLTRHFDFGMNCNI